MTHTKEKASYICDVCNKEFLGSSDLQKHIRVHTGERPFQCPHCPNKFRQAGCLKNHVAAKHSTGLMKNELFICNYCHKIFPIKERLRLHLRVHTGVKPYECWVCEKKFGRGGQLIQHMRIHTGTRPFMCTVCNRAFTCSANLKLHEKRHLEIRDYICDICGKSFFRKDALRKHLNCIHKNVKAFHCKICNKDFKGHLPQHMRTHKKEKPHGCAHCGAAFAQRSQLTVHQRVHSGEKPYRCQVCWKAFAHSTALKLHTRRHTGEKPFVCVLCKSSFSQLPHLKKHMLCIHKSNKPYVCLYCKSFHKTKAELELHLKKCKLFKNEPKVDSKTEEPTPMTIEKMRFLLAILLKKISAPGKLEELGFNKKLIDDILIASIENSGRKPCNEDLPEAQKLKNNIQILLEWTVPKHYWAKFKNEQRSIEELLEELTS